jgi:hypothetical protein
VITGHIEPITRPIGGTVDDGPCAAGDQPLPDFIWRDDQRSLDEAWGAHGRHTAVRMYLISRADKCGDWEDVEPPHGWPQENLGRHGRLATFIAIKRVLRTSAHMRALEPNSSTVFPPAIAVTKESGSNGCEVKPALVRERRRCRR